VILGKERCFTYDHVFDIETAQETIFTKCVLPLLDSCFNGYNATILAYGQTGSGKVSNLRDRIVDSMTTL
jgi:kinesin family protein 4/21/27